MKKKVLALGALLLIPLSTAWSQSLPMVRPLITDQVARGHDLDPRWQEVKSSQVSMVLELFHVYRDYEIYFLARDAELLYDTAILLSELFPTFKNRIHLLNVSRLSVTSPHLEKYLAQEGISQSALKQGTKFLLVDTGFAGTISLGIQGLFAEEHLLQIQTHLVSSAHPEIPSSRVFQRNSDSRALSDGVAYLEGLSPYTNTAKDYELREQKWVPVSTEAPVDRDSPPDPDTARKYQEDLLYGFRSGAFSDQIQKESRLWRMLLPMYYSGLSEHEKIRQLRSFLNSPDEKAFREAMVRDMTEVSLFTRRSLPFVSNTDLGLPLLQTDPISLIEMIDAHPHFKNVFAFPDTELPALFEAENFSAIRELVFDISYSVLSAPLGELLAAYSAHPKVKAIIEEMFHQGIQSSFVFDLILYTLSQPGVVGWDGYIKRILDESGGALSQPLIRYVFSQPGVGDAAPFIDTLLAQASQPTLTALARYVFSQPHSAGMESQLYQVVMKASEATLKILAESVFSTDHGPAMTTAFKIFKRRYSGTLYKRVMRCEDWLL